MLLLLGLGLSMAAPAEAQPAPWWNSSYHYRAPLIVNTSGAARDNWPVEAAMNFTDLLQSSGCEGTCKFDTHSVRVVEYTGLAGTLLGERPSQFDPDFNALDNGTYNNTTNAAGTVSFILNGTVAQNPSNTSRYFYVYFDVASAEGPSTFPGAAYHPKEAPVYTTGLSATDDGRNFTVNTTSVNVSVDTDRQNTSGITNISLPGVTAAVSGDSAAPDGIINVAANQPSADHIRLYNNSSGEWTTANFSRNYTIYRGPVRTVVVQRGLEAEWGNVSNTTCNSCNGNFTKRYYFYTNTTWIRVEMVYRSPPGTLRGSPNGNTPSLLRMNLTLGAFPGSNNNQFLNVLSDSMTNTDYEYRCTEVDTSGRSVGIIDTFDSDPYGQGGPNNYIRTSGTTTGSSSVFGTILDNTSLQGPVRFTTDVAPAFATYTSGTCSNPNFFAAGADPASLWANETNPLNVTSGSPELWRVNLTPRTEFGGENVSAFNRGETLNVTGLITSDAHLLNNSAGPQNATLSNASGSQELGLVKVNDTNWSRAYAIATNADVSALWTASLRINDSAGLLLNRSNATFTVTDIYWVNATNLSNYGSNPSNASGYVLLINGSPVSFNASVHNDRWAPHVNQSGAYGITGLGWQDLDCTYEDVASPVNKSNATLSSSDAAGNYTFGFASNSTLRPWNLSCFVNGSGPGTLGNHGSNTTLRYLTEPRGTNVSTATNVSAATVEGITGTQNNSTAVSLSVNNTGLGHAFDVNLSIPDLPAGWGVDVGGVPASFPYTVFSSASMNNTTARSFNVTLRIAANTSPGTYVVHFNTTWKNLEEKAWGNQTWNGGQTNNSSASVAVTVASAPFLSLNTTRVAVGNVSENTTTVFPGIFLLNNTGNDWLNGTVFTLNQSNFTAGISVAFSKNNSNIPPNNTNTTGNNSVNVTVSVAKSTPAGDYEGRFDVNATGSYANCGSTPFGNCNGSINVSLSISQNTSWTTYDWTFNNSTNPGRSLINNTMDVSSGDTNLSLGFLNVSNEANVDLLFNVTKVEQGGHDFVNRSSGNGSLNYVFRVNSTDPQTFQNLTLNYTIPNAFSGTSWVNITVAASVVGCPSCPANHLRNNTTWVSFNFTLRAADLAPPNVTNVSLNGDNSTTNISALVFDAGRDTIAIAANVTDAGTGVRDVWANVSLPNGSWNNATRLLAAGTDYYQGNFAVPALNGTYALFIVALDNNTTANCAVNNSASTGPCSPWPGGGLKFNATNTTNGSLEEGPLTFEADNVTFPGGGQNFSLNTTFRNGGPGGAYNVWLNLSIYQNNTTALAINGTAFGNQSCSTVARGASCTRFFNVTALPRAFNGTYAVNATLYWENPNGSVNNSVANSTVLHVWANPVLNLTNGANASVEGQVVNVTVGHNTTNFSVPLRVFANGNSPLANVTWNMTGVNASGAAISFALNTSGLGTYPGADVAAGTYEDVSLNVTVPDHHPNGTWEYRFEANASGSACVSALRCGKAFNLSVTVPTSRNWTLNDSTGINLTCGPGSSRVSVDSVTSLCAVRVNNTANVDLNFTLAPANQTIANSTGDLGVNLSQFVILRLGGASSFSIIANTTGVSPGQYNLTIAINASDNATGGAGTPSTRNITVNLTVFTKPLLRFLNASTPTASNFSEAGKQVLIVAQGEDVDIRVNATDASGSAKTGIRDVEANVTRPDGTGYINVSTDCLVNCTFTANNNSTWRIVIPGANFTLRGNHTANLSAVDNLGNPSDVTGLTLRVKPKLVPVINTSKASGGTPTTAFGPNDYVYWNIYVPDLRGDPVASTNVSLTFLDPLSNAVSCTTNTSTGTTDSAGSIHLLCKMVGSSSGTYTWNVTYNFTDAANNTTSTNFTTGTLTVAAADLYVTASAGGPWKPGDTMTVTVSTKDQNLQTLGVGSVAVRVELYYPNSTLYETNSSPAFLAGPELWSATLPVGTDVPFGPVGSANSTYFAKAVANKTGSNITVNDSKVVYITDTLTASLSVGTPQFNNSTMNASFVVFRSGNVLVDPDSFVFNVTSAADAALTGGNCAAPVSVSNISALPANVQRLGTGYFLVQCQLQAAQPQGFYKANLTVSRKGISAGDLRAFQISLAVQDVEPSLASSSIAAGGTLQWSVKVTNPSDASGDVLVTAYVEGTSTSQQTQKFLSSYGSFTVAGTFTPAASGRFCAKSEPAAGSSFAAAGPACVSFTVGGGGATPAPAGGAGGGGGAAGGGAAPGAAERPVLKIDAPREVDAVRGYRLNTTFTVTNAGNTAISDLAIGLEGVPRSWWTAASEDGTPGLGILQTKRYVLTLLIPPDVERGRLPLTLSAEGGGARDDAPVLLTIYGDWSEIIPQTLSQLNDTLSDLKHRAQEAAASGANVSALLPMLRDAEGLLDQARESYLNHDYNAASSALGRARSAMDRANAQLAASPPAPVVPVTPLSILVAIVAVLASAALGIAVWTGQIARSLSKTARGLVLGPQGRPAAAAPPAPRGPPPASPPPETAPQPRADVLSERMARARESTERLLKSLEEQTEKGLISRKRYEELVRKIRR